MNLKGTELAVLSACDAGDVTKWQGFAGLGRALMLAGAKSVVLSLWHVDDVKKAELTADFYSALS